MNSKLILGFDACLGMAAITMQRRKTLVDAYSAAAVKSQQINAQRTMMKTIAILSLLGALTLAGRGLAQDNAELVAEYSRLQGTWKFASLETDGAPRLAENHSDSYLAVRDNQFTMTSADGIYKGTFTLDPEKKQHRIDFHFKEGPEAGETALGIYELDKGAWRICFALGKTARPTEFATKAGSGTVFEILQRSGTTQERAAISDGPAANPAGALDPELQKMQGEWLMLAGEMDGQKLPESFLKGARRVAKGDTVTVRMSGQRFWHARVALNTNKQPREIDYEVASGPSQGKKQFGIYEWDSGKLKICFADPGKDRPTDFTTEKGSGRSSSVWERRKDEKPEHQ